MNPRNYKPGSYEKAEYEAAFWLIRLADEPDNTRLQAEFSAWRDESELNADLYDETRAASELIEKTEPVTRGKWDETWSNPKEIDHPMLDQSPRVAPDKLPIDLPASQSLTQRLYAYIADWKKITLPVALACSLLFFLAPVAQLHLQADYLTTTAEQKTITLEDGTQITLAAESAVSVDFSADKRQLRLLKGQAFFQVSPDSRRPFSVQAGETQTAVLGTAFNVRLTEDSTTVTVEEGNVQVSDNTITPVVMEELHVGDRLRVIWHQEIVRDQMPADSVAAWRQGELVAYNLLMSDIVDTLRSYHQGVIIIQSASFSELRVSGLYKLNDPIATLSSLATAYGASVTQVTPWLLVVSD